MNKIKKIVFHNTKSNKDINISFSKNNNIIVGPKGGGKTTLFYIIACAISNYGKKTNLKFPMVTKKEKLNKFNLELKKIIFYDGVSIEINDENYTNNCKIQDSNKKEIESFKNIINGDRRIVLQEDKVKSNFFEEIIDKERIYEKYLRNILSIENSSKGFCELLSVYSIEISKSIFQVQKIINETSKQEINWYEIKNISNIESEEDILNLFSIKNIMNDNFNSIQVFKDELIKENLGCLYKVKDNNKNIFNSNYISDINIKTEELIKKTNNFEIILSNISKLLKLFNSSCEELIKKINEHNQNNLKIQEYKNNSKIFFSILGENFKIIRNNLMKINSKLKEEIELIKEKDIFQILDDKTLNEYPISKENKIKLSFRIENLNIKNIVENILINPQEIKKINNKKTISKISFNYNEDKNIIFTFLKDKNDSKQEKYFFNFNDYKTLSYKDIVETFIIRNSINNVYLKVYDILHKEIKEYDIFSAGEKSIYGIMAVLDKFHNQTILIDQPEDNLDNETISKNVLNKLKDRNNNDLQTFIVTHNANIGILSNTKNGECSLIIADIHKQKYLSINDPWNQSKINKQHKINEESINYLEGSFENLKKRFDILSKGSKKEGD